MLIVFICEIWIIPKLCPPVPFASKSGGHVPQRLWERRPWLSLYTITTIVDKRQHSLIGDAAALLTAVWNGYQSTILMGSTEKFDVYFQ